MKSFLQKKLINLLVRNLFNGITIDDILNVHNPLWMEYKGKRLSEDQVQRLKEDAERFRNSTIWKMLSNEVKYKANRRMFDKSITPEDILMGKAALYVLDIIEMKIEEIARTP